MLISSLFCILKLNLLVHSNDKQDHVIIIIYKHNEKGNALALFAVVCSCSRSLLQYCAVQKLQQQLPAAANGLFIYNPVNPPVAPKSICKHNEERNASCTE